MSLLDLLRSKPAASGSLHRVRVLSASMLKAWDEAKVSHRNIGDVLEVTADQAATLVGDGTVERLAIIDGNGTVVESKNLPAKPTRPVKATPAPAPAGYSELPAPFTRAHGHLARREALLKDLVACREAALPPGFLKAKRFAESRGELTEKYWIHHGYASEEEFKTQLQKNEHVAEAEEALREFDKAEGYRLASEMVAAGRETLAKIDAANVAAESLARIALELFSLRLAPLELHPAKVRSLFAGSGLAVRYAGFSPIGDGNAVWLGGQNPARAMDEPLPTMVYYYRHAATRLAEVETLLDRARAELAAAQGVAAAPATKLKRAA